MNRAMGPIDIMPTIIVKDLSSESIISWALALALLSRYSFRLIFTTNIV
ncbi:hypothetical protein [Vulcanisaeta sp. JCM 16159]|nr:hypothetical protein [Vulcanisaeta sp. JCM 16159]